jgi:hypothetical protein
MPLGGILTILVLLPNLLMLRLPPVDQLPEPDARSTSFRIFEVVERVGQASAFLIPFFYTFGQLSLIGVLALAVMTLSLLFYYAGWARYLRQGRKTALFYQPMLGVPQPMALAPLTYFAGASVLLQSLPLAAAVIVLAIGHLYISQAEAKRHRSGIVLPS